MPKVTKASLHPCDGIQAELLAYAAVRLRPKLQQYTPLIVQWGINKPPSDNLARQFTSKYPTIFEPAVGNTRLPNVDFISTEHHGETLFDWMWNDARDADLDRATVLAKHIIRGLAVLAHMRHEGCAHQDAACWNFCVDGVWIDLETAVMLHAPECRPHPLPEISVWQSFDMTVSGTDSATFLLSVIAKGPPWAAQSQFVAQCVKAVVPPVLPGCRARYHPSYMHAAERPLLDASAAVRAAENILKAESGGALVERVAGL